jgi:transcriptional regulator with XRE-family HTH domain
MRYVYLEITQAPYNPDRAKLERKICGITYNGIASVINAMSNTISTWERTGNMSDRPTATAYRKIARGIHNHAAEDYFPCPTLISLAPKKWSKYRLNLMHDYQEGYYDDYN